MNLNINANSPGERIVLGLVVLSLVIEMLSDNFSWKGQATPMTIEACEQLCWKQNTLVKRVEGWVCECEQVAP